MPDAKKVVTKKLDYTYAVGRRKTATARVRLYSHASVPGHDGVQMLINGKSAEVYFPGETAKASYRKPFHLTETLSKMSVSAVVEGSGKAGQLDAVVHGIARALSLLDRESYRGTLKAAGLLTRDARAKQRRMIGTGGKSRRKKQSPKR
ncbi:MAG: 30S ribosomal protein S9 [bacterium]